MSIVSFVSLDPSMSNTGVVWGYIDTDSSPVEIVCVGSTTITTKKSSSKQIRASSDTVARFREQYIGIKEIIVRLSPQVVFAETPSGSQSANGMKSYGGTCAILGALDPEPIQVTPQEVKMCSIGSLKASKRDIIDWAFSKYPDLEWSVIKGRVANTNEHVADSIAVVYAGVKTTQFNMLTSLLKRHDKSQQL